MSQFQPISLYNTSYKVISKIIVKRLRPLVGKLISLNQASFIPVRQIIDNVAIVQEVLHFFHKSKSRKGFVM